MKSDGSLSKEISRNLLFALNTCTDLFYPAIAPLISHWQASETELQMDVLQRQNVSENSIIMSRERVVLKLGSWHV